MTLTHRELPTAPMISSDRKEEDSKTRSLISDAEKKIRRGACQQQHLLQQVIS